METDVEHSGCTGRVECVCVMVVVSLLLWSLRGTLAGVHSLSLSFHVHLVSLIYIGCSTGKRCVLDIA